MANLAKFTINSTPSSPGGFDMTISQALTFLLEGAVASLVNRWTLEVYSASDDNSPRASKNAPTLTLVGATSGQKVDATTPASAITSSAPSSGVHSYIVRSKVNGGLNAKGKADPDYVYERIICIKTGSGLRKAIVTEQNQYSAGGWADAQNDLIDAGAGPLTAPGGAGDANKIAAASGAGTNLQYAAGLTLVGAGALNFLAQAAPGTPAAGNGRNWFDATSKKLATKDESGTVRTVNGGGVWNWGAGTATSGQYLKPGNAQNAASSASIADSEVLCPCAGTLSMLASSSIPSTTFTVYVEAVATTLTCTSAAGGARDATHVVPVAAGNHVGVKATGTAGGKAEVTLLFTPSE